MHGGGGSRRHADTLKVPAVARGVTVTVTVMVTGTGSSFKFNGWRPGPGPAERRPAEQFKFPGTGGRGLSGRPGLRSDGPARDSESAAHPAPGRHGANLTRNDLDRGFHSASVMDGGNLKAGPAPAPNTATVPEVRLGLGIRPSACPSHWYMDRLGAGRTPFL